jgi:hypothetical protein
VELDEIEIGIEELRAELSERGQLEFEMASLRAINRKLAAMVRAQHPKKEDT